MLKETFILRLSLVSNFLSLFHTLADLLSTSVPKPRCLSCDERTVPFSTSIQQKKSERKSRLIHCSNYLSSILVLLVVTQGLLGQWRSTFHLSVTLILPPHSIYKVFNTLVAINLQTLILPSVQRIFLWCVGITRCLHWIGYAKIYFNFTSPEVF